MKKLTRILVLVVFAFIIAAHAFADIAPPLRVRLVGLPEAAAAGQPTRGQIALTAGADGVVDYLVLEGSGWKTSLPGSPGMLELAAGETRVIDFTAVPTDPRQPLTFSCLFEDRPVSIELDFSEEFIREHVEGLVLVPHEKHGLLPPPNFDWRTDGTDIRPEVRFDKDMGRGGALDQPDKGIAGIDITVHGSVAYFDTDPNRRRGAYRVRVRVWDADDGSSDDLMGETFTDVDGDFSLVVNTDAAGETFPDLYVTFQTWSWNTILLMGAIDVPWGWSTSVQESYLLQDLDIGEFRPPRDQQPALHVYTILERCRNYARAVDYLMTQVTGVWPVRDGSSYGDGVIYIDAANRWQEYVIGHEYGHFFHDLYGANMPAPDYCNGVCDDFWVFGCNHCRWCRENPDDAWNEGWAEYFGHSFKEWFRTVDAVGPLDDGTWGIGLIENLMTCQDDGQWHDPVITEGYIAALLFDIEDAANDIDPRTPLWRDSLATGREAVFAAVTDGNPASPAQFLGVFRQSNPSLATDLWETAANCGYNPDHVAPTEVYDLGSPSHPVNSVRADPHPTFMWLPSVDSYAGLGGYGYSITTAPAVPPMVRNLGPVTSFTAPAALAPGTYYFNLRAVDRANNWSNAVTHGPFTIRAGRPADLVPSVAAGWQYPLVPAFAPNPLDFMVEVTPTLPGYQSSTWLNFSVENDGEEGTVGDFHVRVRLDGTNRHVEDVAALEGGDTRLDMNNGPYFIRGGRHSLTVFHDDTYLIHEGDETNNVWGRQFVWTPETLPAFTVLERDPAAIATRGHSEVTEGDVFDNCNGYRFDTDQGAWNAVALWTAEGQVDYRLRLHAPTSDAETGFAEPLAESLRPETALDWVLANGRQAVGDFWDIGVSTANTYAGYPSWLYQAASSPIAAGDAVAVDLPDGVPLVLYEFEMAAADLGPVTIQVTVDPARGPVKLQHLDPGTDFASPAGFVTTGDDGEAVLTFTAATAGWHGLCIWRDPGAGFAAAVAQLEIQILATMPPSGRIDLATFDFEQVGIGSQADTTFTIANAGGGTLRGSVLEASGAFSVIEGGGDFELASGASRTVTARFAPTAASEQASVVHVDGILHGATVYIAGQDAGLFLIDLEDPTTPVLGSSVDTDHQALAVTVVGGHAYVADAESGLKVVDVSETAAPVVVASLTTPDRVNEIYLQDGYAYLAIHNAGLYVVDVSDPANPVPVGQVNTAGRAWEVVVRNSTAYLANGGGGLGIYDVSDPAQPTLLSAVAAQDEAFGIAVAGDYSYLAIHEAGLAVFDVTDPANPVLTGTCDTPGSAQRVEVVGEFAYVADGNGGLVVIDVSDPATPVVAGQYDTAGQARSIDVVPPYAYLADGSGGLKVFDVSDPAAPDSVDVLDPAGAARDVLVLGRVEFAGIGQGVSAVDDVPVIASLTGNWPNPFNPRTTIGYDLPAPARVELTIYDVSGRLVRRLGSDLIEAAGSHRIVWDGTDASGRTVAAGVYLYRLRAGNFTATSRCVLVK